MRQKRKTRPGGQPDGSSHMGAWGGWALAPNTASMGRDNRSHRYKSQQRPYTFKPSDDFFKFFAGRIFGRKSIARRGDWSRQRPIYRTPWRPPAGSGPVSGEPVAGLRHFQRQRFQRRVWPESRRPAPPARRRWPRPRQRHRLRRRRIDRRDRGCPRSRAVLIRIARRFARLQRRIALQHQGRKAADIGGGKRGPDVIWYLPSGAGRKISTPGAAMAIWPPRFDAANSLSPASVALTAITLALAAG